MTVCNSLLAITFTDKEVEAMKTTIKTLQSVSLFFEHEITDIVNGDFIEKEEIARTIGILDTLSCNNDKYFRSF